MATYEFNSASNGYKFILNLTQNYTAGSSKVGYTYELQCQAGSAYYEDWTTTRQIYFRVHNSSTNVTTILNTSGKKNTVRNGTVTFDSGTVEVDRYDSTNAYTLDLYVRVATSSGSYVPGDSSHTFENVISVPSKATACQSPTITYPTGNIEVSNTNGFTLTWNAGTPGTANPIAGYKIQCRIYHNNAWGSFQEVATTTASTLSYKIVPVSYGATYNDLIQCRVKCVETITIADNWYVSAGRTTIHTPTSNQPTLNPSGTQKIASTSTGITITATPISGNNTIRWYQGSTLKGSSNSIKINPSVGSSLTYQAYEYDGIDQGTECSEITVTKQTRPMVTGFSPSFSGSGDNVAYDYLVSCTPTRSRAATQHKWEIVINNAATQFSTAESLSGYNLFNAIDSNSLSEITYTIRYSYYDGIEWSNTVSSSSQKIGSTIEVEKIINQWHTDNITATDFILGSIYNKGRLYYKIGGKYDPNFEVDSFTLNGYSVVIPSGGTHEGNGWVDFQINNADNLTSNASITVQCILVSKTGRGWSRTFSFTFTECGSPLYSITGVPTSVNPNIASGTFQAQIGFINTSSVVASKLYIYSSKNTTLVTNYYNEIYDGTSGGTYNNATYTTTGINQSDIYTIGTNNWYTDENSNGNTCYFIVKYTNALGKTFYLNKAFTINFLTVPVITSQSVNYTITSDDHTGAGALQYGKTLKVSATVTFYNTVEHTIIISYKNSGSSTWSQLRSETFAPTPGILRSGYSYITGNITIPQLKSTSYDIKFEVINKSLSSNNSTSQLKESISGIMQYSGSVSLLSADSTNALYSITNSGIPSSRPGNTTITATFQISEDQSIYSDEGNSVSNDSFILGSSIPINLSGWSFYYGRIKVVITTTQTIDDNPSTATLTYYSNVLLFYNIIPTISPRPNYLGINAATAFSSDDLLLIQSLTERNKIRFYKQDAGTSSPAVAYISLGATTIDLVNFKIDGGSW